MKKAPDRQGEGRGDTPKKDEMKSFRPDKEKHFLLGIFFHFMFQCKLHENLYIFYNELIYSDPIF